MRRQPTQLQLPLAATVMPSQADLRAVFERSHLAMPFSQALAMPATARCLMAAARAHITAHQGRRRRR